MGVVSLFAILATLLIAAPAPVPTERVLNVPWAHQVHNLSCEAAALKMALSYYGISVDELKLISYMTRDPRPARFDMAGHLTRWGDPAAGFVGNPDGRIERYTGYGVYYQPVALAAMLAGANVVEAGSGLYGAPVPPAHVYQAVLDGDPVIAWISNTYRRVDLGRCTPGSGNHEFKSRWGCEEKPLHWYYWLSPGASLPELRPSNPRYRLLVKLWKRLPLFVANRLGPRVVRALP